MTGEILKFKALGEMTQRSRRGGANYVRLEDFDKVTKDNEALRQRYLNDLELFGKCQERETLLEHQRDRYAKFIRDIISASGLITPDPLADLAGEDLIAQLIRAMWLTQNQRETLDQARQAIEMFMPNIGKCFGIDVGALNRTLMNIAMVQKASPAAAPVIDFNKDVLLTPPPREVTNIGWERSVLVSFDGAEGQGRVWLADVLEHDNQDENMVAIPGIENARKLATLLNAWADTYNPEKPSE